jgi:hypothetical protein
MGKSARPRQFKPPFGLCCGKVILSYRYVSTMHVRYRPSGGTHAVRMFVTH